MPHVIGLDDWTVQTKREEDDYSQSGPYVTVGIFRGKDAEKQAKEVVEKMNSIAPGMFWAWSGQDILNERHERLGKAS